jgi:hypothetical protein
MGAAAVLNPAGLSMGGKRLVAYAIPSRVIR